LSSAHGDYAVAYTHGLFVALAFVGAALVVALVDLGVNRAVHAHHREDRNSDVSARA
jgi:hypothetical protein